MTLTCQGASANMGQKPSDVDVNAAWEPFAQKEYDEFNIIRVLAVEYADLIIANIKAKREQKAYEPRARRYGILWTRFGCSALHAKTAFDRLLQRCDE